MIYALYSDAQLDDAYQLAHDKLRDRATRTQAARDQAAIAEEIVSRMSSIFGGASSLFGSHRFPKYEALTKFDPVQGMRTSVKDSAAAVADAAKSIAVPGVFLLGAGLFVAAMVWFRVGRGK